MGQDCAVKFAPRVLSNGVGNAELGRGLAVGALEEATVEVEVGLPVVEVVEAVGVDELGLFVVSVNSCRRTSSASKLSNCQEMPTGGGR